MRAENDAALERLRAVWSAGKVYAVGDAIDKDTTPYAIVSVDSGLRINYRRSSRAVNRTHRISVQVVGDTYREAAFAAEKADAAFLDHSLAVTGARATPCRDETATDLQRDPDGGVLIYGLRTYTFLTNPA